MQQIPRGHDSYVSNSLYVFPLSNLNIWGKQYNLDVWCNLNSLSLFLPPQYAPSSMAPKVEAKVVILIQTDNVYE